MFKSFEEVVAFAIGRESQAADFYQISATKSEKPATKSMFNELAAEEMKHKNLLEKLTSEQLKNFKPSKIENLGLSSIIQDAQFSPDMEYPAALRMAIKKEEEAIQLYSALAEQSGLGGLNDTPECGNTGDKDQIKQLFDFLVEQEKQHKNQLEAEYNDVVLKDY
jgi:rubrerythrin